MATDAYATATALAALHACIDMPATDKTYRHGMDFLLRSQAADGSWHVASRSDPFQKYFETGFPHGNDQWISSTATAWAIIALSSGLAK
jgi:squalene cyclase